MNKGQKQYIKGIITRENQDIVYDGIAGLLISGAIYTPGILPAIGFGLLSLPFVAVGALGALCRAYQRHFRSNSNSPFRESKEIIFEDRKGLETLLDVTSECRINEWGTVQKAHMDNGRAIIHEILDLHETQRRGLIKSADERSIAFDSTKIIGIYDGIHHYHPSGEGQNFAINPLDRTKPGEWVNLLTFNMPYGPEIIGFNLDYTYIPAKREDKSRLVRAKTRDIWRYLKQA